MFPHHREFMIRLLLADTKRTAIVQAAGKTVGLSVAVRAFSEADLDALQAPAVLVFDAGGRLTPESLQRLRRTSTGAVRHSPAVVFCTEKHMAQWRASGAVALSDKAGVDEVARAVKFAASNERRWIASTGYVGPDRRTEQTFQVFRRRAGDQPANENAAPVQRPKSRFW